MAGSSTTELKIYQNIEVKQPRDAYPNVIKTYNGEGRLSVKVE